MTRRSLVTRAATLAFPLAMRARAQAGQAAAAQPEATTTDVCEVDFPPVDYGKTLKEVEAVTQTVVERVFRDADGMILGFVNGRTMKPLRPEEVKDRPLGMGTFVENSAIPREFKPIWLNYENADAASGKYLMALCTKARVTGNPEVRKLARRTVDAILLLCENAAATRHSLGGGGKGWLPKPYGGVRNVSEMWETSADQYADITLGLHSYYQSMANEEEKQKLADVIGSFAEWWYDHDYAGVYLGNAIWWKRLNQNFYHPHSVGYFLYVNALAQSLRPSRKFEKGLQTWLELKDGMFLHKGTRELNGCGIALDCVERLSALRPDLGEFWKSAASHLAGHVAECVEGSESVDRSFRMTVPAFAAHYVATAHRMLPQRGYEKLVRRCLEASTRRDDFYHIQRGRRISELPKKVSGDDYRNAFSAEKHINWMDGYWNCCS